VDANREPQTTLNELLEPFNLAKLARDLDVEYTTVAGWRRGAQPQVRHLPKLAEYLRVDLAELTRIVADNAANSASEDSLRAS
jgi:hypothetical protein